MFLRGSQTSWYHLEIVTPGPCVFAWAFSRPNVTTGNSQLLNAEISTV